MQSEATQIRLVAINRGVCCSLPQWTYVLFSSLATAQPQFLIHNTRIFGCSFLYYFIDSANRRICESQNLDKNNLARSANLETRPLRGAKNRKKASSSGKADFLLEAEKRGSPPKSEKRSFWETHLNVVGGSGNRGVQPFCEKELSAIDGKGIAESQGGLPRRFRECSAHNDNLGEGTESNLDSINPNIQEQIARFCELYSK